MPQPLSAFPASQRRPLSPSPRAVLALPGPSFCSETARSLCDAKHKTTQRLTPWLPRESCTKGRGRPFLPRRLLRCTTLRRCSSPHLTPTYLQDTLKTNNSPRDAETAQRSARQNHRAPSPPLSAQERTVTVIATRSQASEATAAASPTSQT